MTTIPTYTSDRSLMELTPLPHPNIPAETPNTPASATLGSAPCRTKAFDQLV